MTYMKSERTISSREFQQQFARISKQLQPGESIAVTNRGQRIGTFTKTSTPASSAPDFYANLQKLGRSRAAGQRMIEQIVDDLS
jgi:hypothetical protein